MHFGKYWPLMRSTVAVVFTALSTPALMAAPVVSSDPQVIEFLPRDLDGEAVRLWASVCISAPLSSMPRRGHYRWGDGGVWQEFELSPGSYWLFAQRFSNDREPVGLTIEWTEADSGTILVPLDQSLTRRRPRHCDQVRGYQVQADGLAITRS